MNEENIYQNALLLWGFKHQTLKTIEEMSELTTELCHELCNRGSVEAIMEELSDVEIMLGQIKFIFPSIENVKKKKLERLVLLMDAEKKDRLSMKRRPTNETN